MTQSNGSSNQVKIIAAVAVVVIGVIALAAILLSGGDDGSSVVAGGDGDSDFSGETVEYGEVTVIGDPLPLYNSGADDPAVGTPAPEIEGFSVNGDPVDIIPNGRPKMIVFLAHWCPHCQAEVPRVQDWIDEGNLPEDVELWGVATSTNKGQPNYPPSNWLESEGWTSNLMMDNEDYSASAAFGLSGFPFWVILDSNGNVVARASGQTEIAQVDLWAELLAASS